jgi:hypothetical protein
MAVSQSLTLTKGGTSVAANTSEVRILWTSTQSGESWNGYTRTAKYYVSVNGGEEKEALVSYTLPQNATQTIVDTTITVKHNSDGTGKIKVRTWMDTGISVGVVQQTKELTLNVIPRATTIDRVYCTSSEMFETATIINVDYTPLSSSFYNRCNISLNVGGEFIAIRQINIGKKTASTQTLSIQLTATEINTILENLPNSKKGTLRLTIRTYSDSGYSSEIDNGRYKEITLTIPDTTATRPTATLSVSPVSSLASPFNTLYIKGKTKVNVSLTNGATKYGADIKSYKITVDGKTVSNPYESGYITKSVTIKGTVTDSRGYSTTYTKTVTVLDYIAPQIILIAAKARL